MSSRTVSYCPEGFCQQCGSLLEEAEWVPSNVKASTLEGPEADQVHSDGGQRRRHCSLPMMSQTQAQDGRDLNWNEIWSYFCIRLHPHFLLE